MGKMISINIFRRDGVLIAGLSAAALILAAACSSDGGPAGAGGSAGPSLTPGTSCSQRRPRRGR